MKTKLFNLLAAVLLVFGALIPAYTSIVKAQSNETKKVTVHKVLMKDKDFDEFDQKDHSMYVGDTIGKITEFFGDSATEIDKVYFVLTNKNGEYIKAETGTNNLTPKINANKPETTTNINEAVGGLTGTAGFTFNTAGLDGSFKIVELKEKSTYVGKNQELLARSKAVPVNITLPIVNKEGVVEHAHVYPKNTQNKPKIDKNFKSKGLDYLDNTNKKEVHSIGDKIPYVIGTKILKGSTYKKLVWTDSMTKGLTFNKDIKITIDNISLQEKEDYNVISDDQGFTLRLTDSGLKKVEEKAKDKEVQLIIDYTATVNSSATVDVEDINDVSLEYSNKPGISSEPKENNPKNGKIILRKNWSVDGEPISEVENGVTAIFTLQVKENGNWFNIDSYTVTSAQHFSHTFENLDDDKIYRVVERVTGYEPEYVSFNDGVVVIKNKKDSTNPKPISPTEPKVVTYGKRFVKTNGSKGADNSLTGAIFVVKNTNNQYLAVLEVSTTTENKKALGQAKQNLDEAIDKYNSLTVDKQNKSEKEKVDQAQKIYDAAFIKAKQQYKWVTDKDKAIKFVSNSKGQLAVTGLITGSYSLEEVQAPLGFARLSGAVTFNVNENSYKSEGDINYETAETGTTAKEIKNKKITIPQTGGIGTVIFTVVGLAIMAGAGYVMIRRRKHDQA